MENNQDTIVAIATATGYAGVGVIRISGNNLLPLAGLITQVKALEPRYAKYTNFYDANDEVIDSGLLLFFTAPYSFTGQDVIELQCHGSPMVLQMLLKRCLELGCRLAKPGEFSQRAYLNGKLDLVQAESIIDLIHAESEASAKSATRSLQGKFSGYVNQINQRLINLRMFVEASLDFPEEDIEFVATAKIKNKLQDLQAEIEQLLASSAQGVLLNNGANIVIIGRPNVGKSSLLNALANEEVAIVTAIAGTTRDIVKEKIIINGIAFNLIDTAGIRDTDDLVEKIGIERALNALTSAEICLIIIDDSVGITCEDEKILVKIASSMPRIFVHNKIDLTQKEAAVSVLNNNVHVFISAKLGLGIDTLRKQMLDLIGFNSQASDTFIARTRHVEAIKNTLLHIANAFSNWQNLEILAEELRYAHNCLSEITGEFGSDDLLGEIFSKFCIGK
jgi:tRNA modification GTPase